MGIEIGSVVSIVWVEPLTKDRYHVLVKEITSKGIRGLYFAMEGNRAIHSQPNNGFFPFRKMYSMSIVNSKHDWSL